MSRCGTARGSNSWLSLGGLHKGKAGKSFLFTEGSLRVENKEHLFDNIVTLYFILLCSNAGNITDSTVRNTGEKGDIYSCCSW